MDIRGLEGMCEAEMGKGRRNGSVLWESTLDGLYARRKWQYVPNASHRNEKGHWCMDEDLTSPDFLQIEWVSGRGVNGIHAWKQVNHRTEARKYLSFFPSFLIIIIIIIILTPCTYIILLLIHSSRFCDYQSHFADEKMSFVK